MLSRFKQSVLLSYMTSALAFQTVACRSTNGGYGGSQVKGVDPTVLDDFQKLDDDQQRQKLSEVAASAEKAFDSETGKMTLLSRTDSGKLMIVPFETFKADRDPEKHKRYFFVALNQREWNALPEGARFALYQNAPRLTNLTDRSQARMELSLAAYAGVKEKALFSQAPTPITQTQLTFDLSDGAKPTALQLALNEKEEQEFFQRTQALLSSGDFSLSDDRDVTRNFVKVAALINGIAIYNMIGSGAYERACLGPGFRSAGRKLACTGVLAVSFGFIAGATIYLAATSDP